jgi:ligand-binding sensor domain-containing protein/two-component sensor histidine kinase
MFAKYTLVIYCLLVVGLSSWSVYGEEIIFTQITTNNGLASNFVNCVSQTKNGYIWVGTLNGLQRYDGFRFTQAYRNTGPNKLPPLPVHQIIAANNPEEIWIRMGQKIGRFNTVDYTFLNAQILTKEALPENYNFTLFRDQKGHTFLLIFSYAILVYNEKTNTFEENDNVVMYPANLRPTCIQEDSKGNLWIAGMAGLSCYNVADHRFYTASDNPKKEPFLKMTAGQRGIVNLLIDRRNRLFITQYGKSAELNVMLLDPGTGVVKSIPNEPDQTASYASMDLMCEENGFIWGYGTNIFNLFDEDNGRFMNFYDPESTYYGIKVSNVFQLFADKDKNLWVATDNGLYLMSIVKDYIRNGTMSSFGTMDVSVVKPLMGRRLIFGSVSGKVRTVSYDDRFRITEDRLLDQDIYRNMPNDENFKMVWDIQERTWDNQIWLSCQSGRLICYDMQAHTSRFMHPPVFKNATVRCMGLDQQRNQWLGTETGLLIKRIGKEEYRLVVDLNVPIVKIYLDKKGALWIGTKGRGVFKVDARKERVIKNITSNSVEGGLSNNRIGDMIQLNDSLLAVVCSANLDILNLKTNLITSFTAYDGLPQRVIESLQTDQKGYLWMSTIGGICRFDYKNKIFRTYDQKDGLLVSSNMSEMLFLSTKLPNGALVFAGDKNFVIFNPKYLNRYTRPDKVRITDVKLFNNYLSVDSILKAGGIRLKHDANFITLYFASLSYGQSNKLKYFYKLSGTDQNWLRADAGQSATFASLAPGNYEFMVRAQNSDGIFSPGITTLNINIVPAFWQTWWFVVLLVGIAMVPIYVIYKLRVRRMLEVQKVRERVARDLHDDVGSTLTSISILSEIANGKLKQDKEHELVRDYLGRIGKNSTQMMESMDDIVWSIKPANDQLPKIAARLREYTATILEPQDIQYTFTSNETGSNIKLNMDKRRHLFLLFKEALNNVSKYAHAKHVSITLEYAKGCLVLCVKDDGVGFEFTDKSNANGLINMYKRTELLKGKLSINTAINAGTEIKLKLPLN